MGSGVQRQSHKADAGACFFPCPVCPFIQRGLRMSLLITGVNAEQKAGQARLCLKFAQCQSGCSHRLERVNVSIFAQHIQDAPRFSHVI